MKNKSQEFFCAVPRSNPGRVPASCGHVNLPICQSLGQEVLVGSRFRRRDGLTFDLVEGACVEE